MKSGDRFFIFLALVLVLLFAARVLENICLRPGLSGQYKDAVEGPERPARALAGLLAGIERAGLSPREAMHYKAIDE